ncbi:MAG: amino acid ABC transporter permease [Hyphomicrobiaceae bacterium]
MAIAEGGHDRQADRSSALAWLHRREGRQFVGQAIIVILLGSLLWIAASNAISNLQRQNIASGFGFWNNTAGFDISQTLIPYGAASTYGQAFWVGLLNTLLVSIIGIAFATIVGFVMGIARLSSNWLIARLATIYVEIARNVPLLLQLFVWYFALIPQLPLPRQSWQLPAGAVLNNRGLSLPAPIAQPDAGIVLIALIAAIIAATGVRIWAMRRWKATGERFPVLWVNLGLILGVPLLVAAVLGFPVKFQYPELSGFNYSGGVVVLPELIALLAGLVFYTGAFIAEIVRSGIQGVSSGQKEAALALGLTNTQTLRLVVIPQAMRIIIPPLTSNYLNLTKNSSLGVAIAYPDLVSVFAGTVLNQTGQAIEVISITMLVYLTLSLSTSAFMNWFNARMKLVER